MRSAAKAMAETRSLRECIIGPSYLIAGRVALRLRVFADLLERLPLFAHPGER